MSAAIIPILAAAVIILCASITPQATGHELPWQQKSAPAQIENRQSLWNMLPRPAPMPPPSRIGFTWTPGAKIYYEIHGSGEGKANVPLILLHGGMGNARHWGNQIGTFSTLFDVIAIESRGHGRSSNDGRALSYHLMASDVLAVMDELQIRKASIVGWSDGAIIGLDLAIHHPDRLEKLFAFAANHNSSGLVPSGARSPTFRDYSKLAADEFVQLSTSPEKFSGLLRLLKNMWSRMPNFRPEQLRAITVQVAVVFAQKDELIKREHAQEQARLIPGSKLIVLEGVSHFAMWQDPNQFNSKVIDFLLSNSEREPQ